MIKIFPFLKQFDRMDCGPACLAMICRFYGKSISLQFLREKMQIGKQGVNLLGIAEAAESVGFRTNSVKLSFESLTGEVVLPAIVHWNQNHFVVLYKVSRKKLHVADPGKGLITYTPEEFKRHVISSQVDESGQGIAIALLLEPTTSFYKYEGEEPGRARNGEEIAEFKSIFKYIIPYRKLIIQLFIGLTVSSLLLLLLPFLTQSVVDVGINTANIHFVYIVLLAQLALLAGRLIVEFVRSWILLFVSSRINVSILTDFLIKLMRLPMGFFDSKQAGDIMQRMNDHQRIESFLTGSSLNALFSLVSLVILSVVLAIYNISILTVFMVASAVYALWVILFLAKRRQLDYRRFDIASKEQSNTVQLVLGMQEIKLHNSEKFMRWNWERLQAKLFKLKLRMLSLNQSQQSGAFFINEGKNIFITFIAAQSVIEGKMTLGSMLAVQYIIGQLNSPIEQMIGFVQSWQNAKISFERLNEIHKMEDEEPVSRPFVYELPTVFKRGIVGGVTVQPAFDNWGMAYQEKEKINGTNVQAMRLNEYDYPFPVDTPVVRFNNVSFTYPGAGNEPVLKDINLQIPQGKTTAIVGVSGSGKTTLLKLLLKFYEPQKGEICLSSASAAEKGVSLSNISHKTWRRHCGVVMQESFIFSDTIASNIAVGEESIDMDRLQHAVTVANVRDFIESLPLGFNTKIGMEGVGISMGQRQRILIARSVYSNPDFIFFDEATNSLDANNESAIVQNLQSFFRGRTVIVVAHRLSTVRNADQIVLLNGGKIEERGTHEELINLKGGYFTLVKNQLELGE